MLSYERIIALVFALGLLLAGAFSANAQSYETALAGFTKDSFNDTDSAVSAVAASGNPLAIEAPRTDALVQQRQGLHPRRPARSRCRDRQAGRAGPPISHLQKLNNRLRRTVEAALGGLLMSTGPVALRGRPGRVQIARGSTPDAGRGAREKPTAREEGAASTRRRHPVSGEPPERQLGPWGRSASRRSRDSRGLPGCRPDSSAGAESADAIASIDNRLALWSTVQHTGMGCSVGAARHIRLLSPSVVGDAWQMVMLGTYTTFVVGGDHPRAIPACLFVSCSLRCRWRLVAGLAAS